MLVAMTILYIARSASYFCHSFCLKMRSRDSGSANVRAFDSVERPVSTTVALGGCPKPSNPRWFCTARCPLASFTLCQSNRSGIGLNQLHTRICPYFSWACWSKFWQELHIHPQRPGSGRKDPDLRPVDPARDSHFAFRYGDQEKCHHSTQNDGH